MRRERANSVHLEAVCIRGWRAVAVRGCCQQKCFGVMLPRDEVPWFVGELRSLLVSSTCRVPPHRIFLSFPAFFSIRASAARTGSVIITEQGCSGQSPRQKSPKIVTSSRLESLKSCLVMRRGIAGVSSVMLFVLKLV